MIPDFSIVTPSYNMKSYLQSCHASIADQEGVTWEHVVCDGLSTDGTVGWLNEQSDIVSIVEKDEGMYDALNKGYDKSIGKYVAHLNCDEQYLPNVLREVKAIFEGSPAIDMIIGNALMVSNSGNLIALRKGYPIQSRHIESTRSLDVLTCSLFLRRSIIDSGLRYDTRYRSVGDIDFLYRVLGRNPKTEVLSRYSTIFYFTDNNLSRDSISKIEKQTWSEGVGLKNQSRQQFYKVLRFCEKFLRGVFVAGMPIEAAFFAPGETIDRQKRYYNSVPGGVRLGAYTMYPFANRQLASHIENAR